MTKSLVVLLAFAAIQGCIWNVASMPQQSALKLLLRTDINLNHVPDSRNNALCTGQLDGFYAFEGQCGADYYACIGNEFYPQECPNGNVFDPNVLNCVSPSATSCKTTLPPTTTTTTMKTTVKPFTCPADGNYPISSCSSSYYTCIGGQVYPQTCPPNSVFDPTLNTCVSVATAPCKAPTTTTKEPFTCKEDGFYEIEPCMSSYYICISGQQYLEKCDGNAVFFGPPVSGCKSPEGTTCASTTASTTQSTTALTQSTASTESSTVSTGSTSASTESTTTGLTDSTTVSTPKPFTCPMPDGFFPITEGVCSNSYYSCVGNEPNVVECPTDTVFDSTLGGCTPLSNASCNTPLVKLRFGQVKAW